MTFLIHHYLDTTAERHPQRPAARFLDESLDYAGLAGRSNQLAHTLVSQGVRRHDRVGIYMDKSIDTPVAMYGIMKTGAAYVPLDPAAPPERVAGLIRDCGIRHLVSAPSKLRGLRALGRTDCKLDCVIGVPQQEELRFPGIAWHEIGAAPAGRPPLQRINESDLAYIIYTSGSTGQPKGIMHTHHSCLSFARWAVAEYRLHAGDRLSNHAPLHFDLSIFDYFAAIVAGAATVIIPEEYTKLPASYSKLLEEQAVSVLFTVPFALIQMLLRGSLEERDLGALRWAIFGGEPFPPVYLRDLMAKLAHVRFDNMYGPAEVNGCTHFTVGDVDGAAIPIGPVADIAEALVVDETDTPVAAGTVGELLVRTPTMMRGYWNQNDLTDRVFLQRANRTGHEERFFRTGDLVQELEDGVLRFVGRKDRQVKVRGYRIELDEIELALTSIDEVEEAAVYVVDDSEGSHELHAQVTLQGVAGAEPAGIAKQLKNRLPWYAVPASVSIAAEFPRTRTGKIDKRSIRDLAVAELHREPGRDGKHNRLLSS